VAAERFAARDRGARERGVSVLALAPATWPATDESRTRLLHVDPGRGTLRDRRVDELRSLLRAGDLVVVNDAATLPASLRGWSRHGPLELRLAGPPSSSWSGGDGRAVALADASRPESFSAAGWPAVLFGPGSWRERTEDRRPPPVLGEGEWIELGEPGAGGGLRARVVSVSSLSPRLVGVRFDRDGASLWAALFRVGRPVQYSYLRGALPLWHAQTAFAGRPVAAEMPSAGRPLRVAQLQSLRAGGVRLAWVTHAAGLSSTGDPALDAALPLPERSELPSETVDAVARARASGGRVVAVGTSVVRALEAAWREGELRAGERVTDLRIGPGFTPRVVSGLLTGLHVPGESHFELLQALAPRALLEAAARHAASRGYLGHEFGDACLILGDGRLADAQPRARMPAA
jgi:S-adenosylmethionine:tRNA ribosyltransferase-isomerase